MSYSFEKKKLKEIGSIIGGGTPSTKKQEYFGGDISWITPKDLSNHNFKYIFKGERNITDKGLSNSSAKLLPKGTVLFSSRAPIGYIAIAGKEVATNQGFKSVVVNEYNNNEFVYYLLLNNIDNIKNQASGSTFNEVSGATMKNIEVLIPPLLIQKKIAHLLAVHDKKIENNLRIIKNLESQAQAIFKSWFVDFEPFEDDEFIESELGLIPKGWEVIDVKKIFDFETGSEPGSKNYMNRNNSLVPFYRVGEMLNETDIYVDIDLLKGKIAKTEDVLVSFDGTVGRVTTGINGGFSSGIKKVSSKVDYITNSFIYVLFKSDFIQNIIKTHATGTTILHASKSIDHMKLPFNKDVYNRFSKIIDPLIKYIRELKIQNKVLNETRDTLLPKLMSGEIRLEED